jgi:alpha-tubulin suppressor-like RCC1 family protein
VRRAAPLSLALSACSLLAPFDAPIGGPCLDDEDCAELSSPDDLCVVGACNARGRCLQAIRDDDGDGHGSAECGGSRPGVAGDPVDCDDTRADAHPDAPDRCNGEDDDCDGAIDEARDACDSPSTRGACEAGRCTVVACLDGWLDCDGDGANGCEVDPTIDAEHCGGCGMRCGVAGRCEGARCDDVEQVTAGVHHSCAVREAGGVLCWGWNELGQLGDGGEDRAPRPTPVAVADLDDAVQVSAGAAYTCALREGGTIACWGDNLVGQLGDGTGPDGGPMRTRPTAVLGIDDAVEIAAGYSHTCARRASGAVACWGINSSDQIGAPAVQYATAPLEVGDLAEAVAIGMGTSHSCAVRAAGTVACWGSNRSGQLGVGSLTTQLGVVDVVGLADATAVAAGASFTCALRISGELACWGYNGSGQLGDGTTERRLTPTPVPAITAATVTASHGHAFALDRRGAVWAWGDNSAGQLGDGSTASRSEPGVVTGLDGTSDAAIDVEAGGSHGCAVTSSRAIVCWGANLFGQLGDGTREARLAPVEVMVRPRAPHSPSAETSSRTPAKRAAGSAASARITAAQAARGRSGRSAPRSGGGLPSFSTRSM